MDPDNENWQVVSGAENRTPAASGRVAPTRKRSRRETATEGVPSRSGSHSEPFESAQSDGPTPRNRAGSASAPTTPPNNPREQMAAGRPAPGSREGWDRR